MAGELQFWFDYSCPYAYLASTQVEALARRTDARLALQPMLLGGLFERLSVPQKLFETLGQAKARHGANDLQRWSRLFGAPLTMPSQHPLRTVEALRATLVAGVTMPVVHGFFRAYWVDNRDIGDRDVIRSVLTDAGHDAESILARIDDAEVKVDLRQRTDRALELGFFGAPGFVVGDEIFWGQDRLHQVEAALGGAPERLYGDGPMAPIDVYFDYSSPFAYLGVSRAMEELGEAAVYKPMLLGAVFNVVGQENIPMLAMSEPKRRYFLRDIQRTADAHGFAFSFPQHFPLKSVLPLRLTLAAGAHERAEGRRLVRRFFRAFWGEGRDISQPEVAGEICTEQGFDAQALMAQTQTPEIKAALRTATEEAVAAGVFGAPTFVVRRPDHPPALFWGVDRMELAARAAQGDDAVL